jgi:tetratricopeptide (TPR) repeat protein
MYWIYLSPIILVAALAGLVIIIGKKSAALKKTKSFHEKAAISDGQTRSWKDRLKSIGKVILHLTEKILVLARISFKKIEHVSSNWALKLKAKRSGRKVEDISLENASLEEKLGISEDSVKIVQETTEKDELFAGLDQGGEKITYVNSEVISRRKIQDEPVVILKKEPLPEDKVQEAALIYRIAENPKDIEAYREIGDYYMGIGNIKDAKESFKMVLKLRPRDLKAKSSLREIEMKMRLGN